MVTITEQELAKIVESIRRQEEYEVRVERALAGLDADGRAPIIVMPIWDAVERLLDAVLETGAFDFASWWIHDTDCGANKEAARVWTDGDGKEWPLTTPAEVLAFFRKGLR